MKYVFFVALFALDKSHPARGAWIEMSMILANCAVIWSHPARGAWIEIWKAC